MDLGKFIFQNKSSPLILQPKMNQTKVKVLLCEGCANLIKKLELLYRQLEKLEMNVEYQLSIVHTKLLEAEGESESDMDSEGLINELESLNVLRTELVNKCSLKLRRTWPRVKLQRLSPEKVFEKLKRSFVTGGPSLLEAATLTDIKIEVEDSGMTDFDLGEDDATNICPGQKIDDSYDYNGATTRDNEEVNIGVPCCSTDWEQKVFTNPTKEVKSNSDKNSVACFESNDSNETKPESKGKHNCGICTRSFYNKGGLNRHIKTVHQQSRDHSCPICGKKFGAKYRLLDHHQVAHEGITPKCLKCNKVFTTKNGLYQHQKKENCMLEKRQPEYSEKHIFCCRVCKKKFTSPSDLRRHFNSVHLKFKKYACHLCDSKFSRKDYLNDHQLKIHSIVHERKNNNRETSSVT